MLFSNISQTVVFYLSNYFPSTHSLTTFRPIHNNGPVVVNGMSKY
nr:MAG TPA: hypothetical protein [Caudoviricetes sp.]